MGRFYDWENDPELKKAHKSIDRAFKINLFLVLGFVAFLIFFFACCKTKTVEIIKPYPFQTGLVSTHDEIKYIPIFKLDSILFAYRMSKDSLLREVTGVKDPAVTTDSLSKIPPTRWISVPVFRRDSVFMDTTLVGQLRLQIWQNELDRKLDSEKHDKQLAKVNNRIFYIIIGFAVFLLALIGFIFYVLKKSSSLTKSLNIQSLQSIK